MPLLICMNRILDHRTHRNCDLGINPALTTHSPLCIKNILGSFLLSSLARWRYFPILPAAGLDASSTFRNSCILFANTCVFQNLISYRMFSAKFVSRSHTVSSLEASLESGKGTRMRKIRVIKKWETGSAYNVQTFVIETKRMFHTKCEKTLRSGAWRGSWCCIFPPVILKL